MSQTFSGVKLDRAGTSSFVPSRVDDAAVTLQALSGQTEDLLRVLDSTGAETFAIGPTGIVTSVGSVFNVYFNIPAGAVAGDYDGNIPIPDAAILVSVTERHQTAGNDAGAVTLMVKKTPSGTAKASGTDTLSAGINLKATADTNQAGSLHATAANYTFAAGDSVSLVTTGTLTAVDGVSVTCKFRRV